MSLHALQTRLDSLEDYLRQDPANSRLLADAFEAALRCGAGERAEFHLRHALALGIEPLAWRLREAHWLLSLRRWSEARAALQSLSDRIDASSNDRMALLQDLAHVDLQEGAWDAGLARLVPVMASATGDMPANSSLQLLWLRLMHRAGRFEEALAWAGDVDQQRRLSPSAAGAAALISLDAGDYRRALDWSERSLAESPRQLEALVARASLALSEANGELARRLLKRALELGEDDGRVWSALGFADLLEHDLPSATLAFERACASMPAHVGTWHGLGWTAVARQDPTAARHAFSKAIEIDRNFSDSHGGLAVALVLAEDVPGAHSSIERARRLDGHAFAWRYAQALLDGEARDPASLMRLAEHLFQDADGVAGQNLLALLRRRKAH